MRADQLLWPILALLPLSCLCLAASCEKVQAPVQLAKPTKERAMNDKPKAIKTIAHVFKPQVAGRFYDAKPDKLRADIESYLAQAAKAEKTVEGDLFGVVVPHAGYPYSGPIAAHAFSQASKREYARVVVLGPAHQRAYSIPALLGADAYRTPLGDIPIDRAGIAAVASTGAAQIDDEKFHGEHALEVELPFLQVALGDFELVPIMVSRLDPAGARALAKALKQTFPGRDTLFVASTDLAHDYPYAVSVAMDENATRLITELDLEKLYAADTIFRRAGKSIRVGEGGRPEPDCAQLCGLGTVMTLMALAKEYGDAKVQVLDRRNSGDIVGDQSSRIVGYAAVALALSVPRPEAKSGSHAGSSGDYLNSAEKHELLQIARKSLVEALAGGDKPSFEPKNEKLNEAGAAFVTLKNKGRLRGCIGYMEAIDPLWKMIRDRAIDAATRDSRFPKVTSAELEQITIEISVLTPRVDVSDPLKEIQIGRDGVWMQIGMNRGVFLPQVPVEQGWKTVEIYLDNLCRKAHIFERDCWRSPQAKIQKFTAVVFGEQ